MWVDTIPLSRPKKNINRDFSDAVLAAETIKHLFPKLVEMHNYSAAHSVNQKLYNWQTLNSKVLRRLGLKLDAAEMQSLARAEPGAIETLLVRLMHKMEHHKQRAMERSGASSASGGGGGRSGRRASRESRDRHDSRDDGRDSRRAPRDDYRDSRFEEAHPPPAHAGPGQGTSGHGARPLNLDSATVDSELLVEKERTIIQLREIVKVLERKVMKLEKLVELKNSNTSSLQSQLARRG